MGERGPIVKSGRNVSGKLNHFISLQYVLAKPEHSTGQASALGKFSWFLEAYLREVA
jgi:hypothetical protein